MIIVSQDKKTSINYENTEGFDIENNEEKWHIYAHTSRSKIDLGYYTSEQNAIDVIGEIADRYGYIEGLKLCAIAETENFKEPGFYSDYFRFYMPDKDYTFKEE